MELLIPTIPKAAKGENPIFSLISIRYGEIPPPTKPIANTIPVPKDLTVVGNISVHHKVKKDNANANISLAEQHNIS